MDSVAPFAEPVAAAAAAADADVAAAPDADAAAADAVGGLLVAGVSVDKAVAAGSGDGECRLVPFDYNSSSTSTGSIPLG